jgi:TATA-binding protein-associated factor
LYHYSKLCSHPRLVLTGTGTAAEKKKAGKGGAHAAAYSPKFLALKQILLDAGVGVDPAAEVGPARAPQ